MKQFIVGLIACICISASFLFSVYEALDITEDKAKKDLLSCMGNAWFETHDNSKLNLKARELTKELKVEGIKQLIATARKYFESEDFKKDYKKWRSDKLNPGTKTKLGLPKFGKILENKIDNKVDKEENEKKYPTDPQELIKRRLQQFLDVAATVDFAAELTANNYFKKAEYEKKSNEWKMLFRMGKEVVNAAEVEVKKWMEEMDKKKA